MKLLKNQSKSLIKHLPKGYQPILAARCGCSQVFISKVMLGECNDTKGIIEAAIQLIKQHKNANMALAEKIKEVCK